MRLYLLAAAVLSLTACTTTRDRIAHQAYHDAQGSEPIKANLVAPVTATPAAGLATAMPLPWVAKPHALGDIFGRRAASPAPVVDPANQPLPKKCKGCTFVYGNATVADKKATIAAGNGASVKGDTKAKSGAVVSQDSSLTNAVTGGGNLAAVKGDDNTTDLTKQDTTTEAPGVGATIAKALTGPLGIVLAVVATGGLVYGFIVWRKKKAAENLV